MNDRRRADIERHLDDLRKIDGWQPFQHFVLGLLPHDGYTDVRYSAPRSDFGRDAVAITPDGQRCAVAVSFECTKKKVLDDARRWSEDPDREPATVLLFITSEAPAETRWSKWKGDVAKLGLELRMFSRPTILQVATRDSVWRETAARLGLSADRPGFRVVTPYDSEQIRAALQARPAEWLAKRIERDEWGQLSGELRNRLVLGKPGAGKTTTLFMHLEMFRPERVIVVEPDLHENNIGELLDAASGGAVIVFDDAHEKPFEVRMLLSGLRARLQDVTAVRVRYDSVRLLIAARSQEWVEINRSISPTEFEGLGLTGHENGEVVLHGLLLEQCRELVLACIDRWKLAADARLVDIAAARAAACDATPLYVLSMLVPARLVGVLRDEHLAHLPSSVLQLWQRYWERLTPVQQGVLRVIKLFAVMKVPGRLDLFNAAIRAFELTPHDVSASIALLKSALWLSDTDLIPTSLDIQLEAVALGPFELEHWDSFIAALPNDLTKGQMYFNAGLYYGTEHLNSVRSSIERGNVIRRSEALFKVIAESAVKTTLPNRTMALNNLAATYWDLAELEESSAGRRAYLQLATATAKKAVQTLRSNNLRHDLGIALCTLSYSYSAMAALEKKSESRSG